MDRLRLSLRGLTKKTKKTRKSGFQKMLHKRKGCQHFFIQHLVEPIFLVFLVNFGLVSMSQSQQDFELEIVEGYGGSLRRVSAVREKNIPDRTARVQNIGSSLRRPAKKLANI